MIIIEQNGSDETSFNLTFKDLSIVNILNIKDCLNNSNSMTLKDISKSILFEVEYNDKLKDSLKTIHYKYELID